jgi:glutamyl-tRNA reductase
MMLLVVGANFRTAPVELREALAFERDKLERGLAELTARYGAEAVILSTCNRVEVYLGRLAAEVPPSTDLIAEFLAEFHHLGYDQLRPALYGHSGPAAVHHLFRVAASLDSLVLGEGQIAGQVKQAYESAQRAGTVGPLLHALFQQARVVAKRVRSETGIAHGKVSVSSLAVDYLTQVFDHFGDKTVLVIGAGKMGELTLKQLRGLGPGRVLVTNRSPEKARQVAATCNGIPLPFEQLNDGLAAADVILSTTGAPEPIVTLERFQQIAPARQGRHLAIIDIAVPRDFDARIVQSDLVDLLVNVDDLHAVREHVLRGRVKHVPAAEAIVKVEEERFLKEWTRRRAAPAIARLHEEWDAIRKEIQAQCFSKLNGKLTPQDQAVIEGALRLLQNKLMHAPLSVLREEAHREGGGGLLEAIYKLFRLND